MRPVAFAGCQGWLHGAGGKRGVILCSAFGLEELSARQSWVILADQLAAAGMPALRFDFTGTGNSADTMDEAGALATWLGNIRAAADWLQHNTEVSELIFIGLRFGATLATAAAEARGGVTKLVLLAPVASGRLYGRELQLASQVIVTMGGEGLTREVRDDGSVDVAGFVTAKATLDSLKGVDLTKMSRPPAPEMLIACNASRPSEARLAEQFSRAGATVSVHDFADYNRLMLNPTLGRPILATIAAVVGWLAPAAAPAVRPPRMWAAAADRLPPASISGASWTETPHQFGTNRGLIGILCQPKAAAAGRPCVAVLSSGRDGHAGWARGGVEMARSLATAGIASLRFDLTFIGDSQPDWSGKPATLYSTASLPDVSAALDFLAARDYSAVTVLGGCSGAYLALQAALADPRIKSAVLRNTQRFTWRTSERLLFDIGERTYVAKIPQKPTAAPTAQEAVEHWLATSRSGRVCYLAVCGLLFAVSRVLAVVCRDGQRLRRAMANYRVRGGRMLVVYSSNDIGRPYFDRSFGKDGALLGVMGGVDVAFVDNADHPFSGAEARRRFEALVTAFVLAGNTQSGIQAARQTTAPPCPDATATAHQPPAPAA